MLCPACYEVLEDVRRKVRKYETKLMDRFKSEYKDTTTTRQGNGE
jgi:hypothetical protein